jgi:hypothetical protein
MKKIFIVAFLVLLALNVGKLHAQSPVEYMESISKEFKDITTDMWDYTSAVAHGKSARKVENRRKDVLKSNLDAQNKIQKMQPYQGDKAFRDSVLSFLKMSYHVINYEYGKIVDMEAISEQSYDAMEAYLLAQEKAGEKLNEASEMLGREQKTFAANHNITLNETKDKTTEKLESANQVFSYYNQLYLIFFKSFKQEAYMIDALNKNDVNALKQNTDALAKNSAEGLKKLDTVKAFKGDNSVKIAGKEMLTFYNNEATTKAPVIINFLVKKENFEKIKKAFESKSQSSRTKADVDEYNNAVSEMNKASNEYNAVNQELNNKRSALLNKWNDAVSKFMDKQDPSHK